MLFLKVHTIFATSFAYPGTYLNKSKSYPLEHVEVIDEEGVEKGRLYQIADVIQKKRQVKRSLNYISVMGE